MKQFGFLSSLAPTSTSASLPGIVLGGGFHFRRGQSEFLSRLAQAFSSGERNCLGVFVPGYGKTITALSSFLVARALSIAQKLVIFVPRGNLRDQYADPQELALLMRNLGAPPLTFCVADSEKKFLQHLATDVIITTYQYASGRGGNDALRQFCSRSMCMFVFDEVHHLSLDGTWAAKIKQFPFSCSVALSGTPMRSDNKSIFGVPLEVREDETGNLTQFYKPLHEVLLRDAHAEGGILKRVQAHVIDYAVKLQNTETGDIVEITLSKLAEAAQTGAEIDAFLTRKKLRFHAVYLEALLKPAFERFAEKRALQTHRKRNDKQHQMLIIAMSNLHAASILDFVQQNFPVFTAARIGQDVAEAERAALLKEYRSGKIDVMVQVDMIGEGTDIKPISVIVKVDLVRALSKTMQQLFRGMRYYEPFGSEGNVCDIYTSNDSEVVQILEWLTSEEQIGVALSHHHSSGGGISRAKIPQAQEAWELMQVEHHEMESHTLELHNGALHHIPLDIKRGRGRPRTRPETMFMVNNEREAVEQAVEQAARERELRQECSELTMKLTKVLPRESLNGHSSAFMLVHTASVQRFGKSPEQMTTQELLHKREWLRRCIKERQVG